MNMFTQVASTHSEVQQRYLIFTIDGDEYGVDVSDVLKVVPFQEVVPIPNSPDFLVGFINLAGDVVPLIDLEVKFQLKREIELKSNSKKIVVIESQDAVYSLLVDAVSEVLTTSASAIQTAPDTVAQAIGRDFLVGVLVVGSEHQSDQSATNEQERVILILDAHSLLSEVERTTVDHAQSTQHTDVSIIGAAQVPTNKETA